jgi:peptide deformylase
MGDPRLLRVAQPVPVSMLGSAELRTLIADMQETMASANGAGLAAPQIGVDLQLVIFGTDQVNPRYPDAPPVPRSVLINPVITPLPSESEKNDQKGQFALMESAQSAIKSVVSASQLDAFGLPMEEGWEGCLSVPGLRGVVPRFARIRYEGLNEHGERIDRIADGFHARVVQHECDHLWGILYPMRVKDFTRFGFTEVLFPGLDASGDDD